MNNFKYSTNTFLCAAQWALGDKLKGLPLGLRTTTWLISHWLNNNSISCFYNSTSSDLWPLIGQNVAPFPVSLISFLIPAKEYYILSVKRIFNSSQKCAPNYHFLKNTKITDVLFDNNSISCLINSISFAMWLEILFPVHFTF